MCDGVVNNNIKRGLLLSVLVKKLKSVNNWQSYKHECGCLVHFAHLANTLLIDEESGKSVPNIYRLKISLTKSAINLS